MVLGLGLLVDGGIGICVVLVLELQLVGGGIGVLVVLVLGFQFVFVLRLVEGGDDREVKSPT